MLGLDFAEGVRILKEYMDDATQVFLDDTTFVFEVAWQDLTPEDHNNLDALGFSEIKTDDGYMVGFQD